MQLDSDDADPGSFKSCSAVEEQFTNDTIWCWELQEDDYGQVFVIALLFLLISLGYYLLTFGAFIWASTSLKGVRFPTGEFGQNNNNSRARPFESLDWYDNSIVTSRALPIYILLYILISLIYLSIKSFIVYTESPHYIWTIDDRFNALDFEEFIDAKVVVMIGIFLVNSTFCCCTNISLLWSILSHLMQSTSDHFFAICFLATWIIISVIDLVFSIIICCIYYPMIFTLFYFVAVGFIVNFVILLICCCISPIVSCIVMKS